MTTAGHELYQELGISPVINAVGHLTVLGGSTLSPQTLSAMTAANQAFAAMEEVLEKTGVAIARMLDTEGAYVSSGCFAALVLGTAGILTRGDPTRIVQLPDTTGMKNEFLIQKATRYRYDRCVSVAGGKLVEVGDERGTSVDQLQEAIGPNTAGILFFARGEMLFPNSLRLNDVVAVAKAAGDVPVLVDAAAEVYPVERIHQLVTSGADLVCFGGKYLGSANSTGILCGRGDLVAAASRNGFIGYESHNNWSIGRGYKIDRQEVIATTLALKEWLSMDHEERLQNEAARIQTLMQGLADLSDVQVKNVWEDEGGAWQRLFISWDSDKIGKTPAEVETALRTGDPQIWVRSDGAPGIYVAVHTLHPGEEQIVLRRLREELGAAASG